MRCILCIDNSNSTEGCKAYWSKAYEVYIDRRPEKVIYWNFTAKVMRRFEQKSTGGTRPQSFLTLLKYEDTPYELIIITDGEINKWDMDSCSRGITEQILSCICSTVIYYIGNEENMNIGLNVIFGRTKKMSYHINEQSYDSLNKFDELQIEDLMSPNFAISLIVMIKNIEATSHDKETREARMAELRGEICRLYSKMEHESLDSSLDEKLEDCFRNNRMQEFIDILNEDRQAIMNITRQKTTILNIFDKKIDFNISKICQATAVQTQDIEVKPNVDSAWSEFEDVITLDKFNLPCLLVQNSDVPIITNKLIQKHPFKLLSEPDIIKKIMLLIEPNMIDYTTYQKLNFDHRGTVSPYTRVSCKGVFLLDVTDMKCVKNNCKTMSMLFGQENKVPGSLILWNLVIMYLLYKYKFDDTEYKSIIFDQIIKYCEHFKASLSFTHQCQVLRPARIEVCLWYSVRAAPTVVPNTPKNVLRSHFGQELLDFYLDTFGRDQIEELKPLSHRVKMWTVWKYLLLKKGSPAQSLEVRAQYQNHCVHKGNIILLTGKCETPYKSPCNILDADTVNTMFKNLRDYSSKTDSTDYFKLEPVSADCEDVDGLWDCLTHVKINIMTCWPYVMCPVTKLHWKECVGEYDVKTESFLRLFNAYCTKYKEYPESYMDLVLVYSKRRGETVLTSRTVNNIEYVFNLFKDVMKKYSFDEYISTYKSCTDEQLRLSKDRKMEKKAKQNRKRKERSRKTKEERRELSHPVKPQNV